MTNVPFPSHTHKPQTPRGNRIRVLVVDDSAVQRAMLMALLESDPEIEVAGFATSGAEAVRAAVQLRPDVISMDLHMPTMDGLSTTRRIMEDAPAPVVIVTAATFPRGSTQVAEVLDSGALALISMPLVDAHNRPVQGHEEFLRTIKGMARIHVFRSPRPPQSSATNATSVVPPDASSAVPSRVRIVGIAASTGGPQPLHEILCSLPASFSLPVLVVQHIVLGFEDGLVDWLQRSSSLPVQIARHGLTLDRPGIHVAPPGKHLTVRGLSLALSDAPPLAGHRPSATVLFRSLAQSWGSGAAGVVLSGMGNDGAEGLRELKHAGGLTIAQDPGGAVVPSMPQAAIRLNIVDHVLPPARIARMLVRLVSRSSQESRR